MPDIHTRYHNALAAKKLQPDPAQEKAVLGLNRFIASLDRPAKKSFWPFSQEEEVQKGVYLHGSVGRGKTMLMDWCLEILQQRGIKAERWHFHGFMLKLHADLKALADQNEKMENRVQKLADDRAKNVDVLCFDEFHVTDVVDAMMLMPLFTRLFQRGVAVIATSNWAPDDLYKNGLQRTRFLPFIVTLKAHMDVVDLAQGTDYRQRRQESLGGWLAPLDDGTLALFDALFREAAGHDPVEPVHIAVGKSRFLKVPAASKSVARLDMQDILSQPLGAADFSALSDRYKLVFLDNLPGFGAEAGEAAKRFMVMIDVLYDRKTRLVVRAASPLEQLYPSQGRLSFEFGRTLSRLQEMTRLAFSEKT